jgi:hypothetical protein
MSHRRVDFRRFGIMVVLLLGAGLACNAPVREEVSPEPPDASRAVDDGVEPSATAMQLTVAAPQTLPASIQTRETEEESGSAVPTFTPIQAPTLAATLTPSATPTRRPTQPAQPGATATPDDSGGPLEFSYNISWRLKDASAKLAIATVTFHVKGGSGEYTYFRDDLEVPGPVFEYEWATCSGNPGSLRVDSSDGQTARKEYFQNPPCPTPTPTP